ncbi:TetR family transcriptional regulator [Pseudolysinimonas kribbensis]|uniref:TetR family transcriptional regulator n=2 Tax=Pseudolysinimonas kribbensis TaxID=433641 RepID=A0ABQ6K1W5_9MICO|nr:TetR family transcriptional regulator [Pseudolysinimonas kribbensis]
MTSLIAPLPLKHSFQYAEGMAAPQPDPESARRGELRELSYRYVLEHGLIGLSLRPLATAIGSSPRVLLFLFGSKEGLIREILARARADELGALGANGPTSVAAVWAWLSDPGHRRLMALWTQCYALSIAEPDGLWAGWAARTVDDWLALIIPERDPIAATLQLAVLRGLLLDLLATGDLGRTGSAAALYATGYPAGV